MSCRVGCVVAVLALAVGCGPSQNRVYNIALDGSALNTPPTSCVEPGAQMNQSATATGLKLQDSWSLWDGVDGAQYLEVGTIALRVGDAPSFQLPAGTVVEGKDRSFSATLTEATLAGSVPLDPTFSSTATRTWTFTFDELGDTVRGALALAYTYSCTGSMPRCNPTQEVTNCSASLPFTGRRVDYTNFGVAEQ